MTDYDPDRSLVLIEGLSHFLTNFLQNLASCQTSFNLNFFLTTIQNMWVNLCRCKLPLLDNRDPNDCGALRYLLLVTT
jgi:hypothetical protein